MTIHANAETRIAYAEGRVVPPGESRDIPVASVASVVTAAAPVAWADHLTEAEAALLYAPVSAAPLKTATVTIATAAVKTLNATPVTLVAAPGAGKALVLVGALFWLDYNSAAYNGIAEGEDLAIKINDGSGATLATVEATGFLDATADAWRYVLPTTAADIAPVADAPLVLQMLVGEIATGNSPLKVRVLYRELALTW